MMLAGCIRITLSLLYLEKCFGNMKYIPCTFDQRCLCHTENTNIFVDCSRKNITGIGNFPQNTSKLNLSYNFIETIIPNVFVTLSYLRVLDLSYNKLSTLRIGSFDGLTALTILNLGDNHLVYNDSTFPAGLFKPLVSLEQLSVKSNNKRVSGYSFPEKTITDLRMLEVLDLDVSALYNNFGKGFGQLKNLMTLYLGNCFIFQMTNETFQYTPHLQNIYISGITSVSYDQGTFRKLSHLRRLEITFNSFLGGISSPIDNIAEDLKWTSIDVLKLGQTSIPLSTFPLAILTDKLFNTSISEIYLVNNTHSAGMSPVSIHKPPQSLRTLDVSNNSLTRFVLDITNLAKLVLRLNELGHFLANYTYMFSKSFFSFLEVVDLSHNEIYTLFEDIFFGQDLLSSIDLSCNNLQDITFTVYNLLNLQFLNLSANDIKSFDKRVMSELDELSQETNIKLDLSDNPLDCSCKSLSFLTWILESPVTFLHLNHYDCVFEKGISDSDVLYTFHDKVLYLQKQCKSYIGLIIGVSFVVAVVLTILIAALFYRYRWKLRYMYYMTKGKYSDKRINESERNDYVYDAFLSYADEDRSFVIKECVSALEQERNLKLCIHQRDFTPGEDITVNITNSIHMSRKTICLVSKSFLKSYYCMFEFNMARLESIYSRDGRNILFLMFYEPMRAKDLPLVMLELVQQQSYIEYPNQIEGNLVFWEKIKETIQA